MKIETIEPKILQPAALKKMSHQLDLFFIVNKYRYPVENMTIEMGCHSVFGHTQPLIFPASYHNIRRENGLDIFAEELEQGWNE